MARPFARVTATVAALGLALALAPAGTAVAATTADLEAIAETVFHEGHVDARRDPAGNGVTDHPAAPEIGGHTDLFDGARSWSSQMAQDARLHHNPNLASDYCCWTRIGENVAVYRGDLSTEAAVRRATELLMNGWLKSDGHRANIMGAEWSQFSVGVQIDGDSLWATTVFRKLSSSSTPPGTAYGTEGPHGNDREAAAVKPTATGRDTSATCAEVEHGGYADADGNAHENSIKCASGHGLASGRSSDEYAPHGAVTRGQVMAFIRRAVERAGFSLDEDAPDYFNDDNGSLHETSANMLAHAGFVVIADSKLRPNEPASRGFIASVAGRALQELTAATATADYFSDDDGHVDEAWINVLAEAGVVTGSSDGSFGPDSGLTRAQMATVLVRSFDALRG